PSRRRHTRAARDWGSDVCSSDLRRLRVENAKLLEQREVLKKSLASSPKCRPEVCPNPTDERSLQGGLVMRGALGLARRLLRLERSEERRVGKEWSRRTAAEHGV